MFASAVGIAQQFTWPVVLSRRFYDKSVESGMAAFTVVNDEGWILTAAHVFQAALVYPTHQKEIAAYESVGGKRGKGSKRKAKGPKRNSKWIVDHSYWWGRDRVTVRNIVAAFEIDLAIAQLTPFDPKWVGAYPRFRDPSSALLPGTSLCRLGFPFHEFTAKYEKGKGFMLPEGAIPAPFFPIEGIFTRNLIGPKTKDGKYEIKYIETSSPGLRGQSGGPIFDTDGVVWGIQSRTNHLALGFSPTVKKARRKVEEHQFLSVGLGVHPEVISAFLKDHGVTFDVA